MTNSLSVNQFYNDEFNDFLMTHNKYKHYQNLNLNYCQVDVVFKLPDNYVYEINL